MHEDIQQKLEQAFPEAIIKVQDTTAGHESHNSLTNLAVYVEWRGFQEKTLIEQHRMVHDALKEDLKTRIHALRVTTRKA